MNERNSIGKYLRWWPVFLALIVGTIAFAENRLQTNTNKDNIVINSQEIREVEKRIAKSLEKQALTNGILLQRTEAIQEQLRQVIRELGQSDD